MGAHLGPRPTGNTPYVIPPVPRDIFFNAVTLLLNGNGTNGAQNNTFLDSSTNNFTVTRNGNTTQGTNTPFSQAAGYWSNYFNGTSDYLNTANNAAFDFGSGNFTVESFFYLTNDANTNPDGNKVAQICSCIFDATVSTAWHLYIIGNSTTTGTGLGFDVWVGSSLTQFIATTTVTKNIWNHVAVVRNGSNLSIYLNGTSVLSTTISVDVNSGGNPFRVGVLQVGSPPKYYHYFPGYISNTRVVKGTAVYTANFTPPTTPLTAISGTSILTCQSNYFKDNSSNNFALTATGTPSVQPFSPFAPTAAYSTSVNGGSLISNAAANYLSIPSTSTLAFGTGDFTIEYWAYTNVSGQYQQCFYNGSTGGMQLYLNPSQQFTYSHSGVGELIVSTIAVNLNTWNHVAVSRSSGTTKTFVNGVQAGTLADTTNWTNTTYKILSEGASPTYGYISNFRVVKGTALYTSNFTPPTAPLTAITNTSLLLSGTNAGIYDNAIKNDLETVGTAQVSTSVVKYGTGSIYINGSGNSLSTPLTQQLSFFTGNYTIEFWVNAPTTQPAFAGLYITRPPGIINFAICFDSSGTTLEGWNGTYRISYSTTVVIGNGWHHVAYVRNNGIGTIYVDGIAGVSSSDSSSNYAYVADSFVTIGRDAGGPRVFTGYIDDLRVTKGIVRYTANFTPPTQAFPLF